ncbi:Uncharacterised protein [Vibrio cholerae]|nr:Uncharacterised protein [Vibrio cholerae]
MFLIACAIRSRLSGRVLSVASKAMTVAPAFAKPSTSETKGVIRIGLSGKSRLTIPIIGIVTAADTAATLFTPSMRSAFAPACSTAIAIATMKSVLSSGLPVTGCMETTVWPFKNRFNSSIFKKFFLTTGLIFLF